MLSSKDAATLIVHGIGELLLHIAALDRGVFPSGSPELRYTCPMRGMSRRSFGRLAAGLSM
ncbi:MAG: hypothetical protein WB989_04755, partial [Mycobacterium sp.]